MRSDGEKLPVRVGLTDDEPVVETERVEKPDREGDADDVRAADGV